MEWLSLLLLKEKKEGNIKDIKISTKQYISHLLFMDDVLLMGLGIVTEWQAFYGIINILYTASGVEVSVSKSSFYRNVVSPETISSIQSFLPM